MDLCALLFVFAALGLVSIGVELVLSYTTFRSITWFRLGIRVAAILAFLIAGDVRCVLRALIRSREAAKEIFGRGGMLV